MIRSATPEPAAPTDTEQSQPDPAKNKKLYQELNSRGLYSKSYEDFQSQFSKPEKVNKLHGALKEQGLVSIEADSFRNRYFSTASETKATDINTSNVSSDNSPVSPDLSGGNTKTLPQNEGNIEEPKEGGFRQTAEELGKGILRGLVDLPKSVSQVYSFGAINPTQSAAARSVNTYLKNLRESDSIAPDEELKNERLSSVYDNPEKLIPYLTGKVGEGVPTTLPGLGAAKLFGGASRAAQIGSAALASSPLEVGGQLEDLEETKDVEDITPGDQALAVGSGLLASGVEGIADAALLRYISNAVNKSGLDDSAKETAKEQIAEGLSDAAIRTAKETGKSMGTEAATEMVQETISNVGANLGWDPDREVLNEGIIEAGVVGGLTGGAITGPASAAGNAAQAMQSESQQDTEAEEVNTEQEQDTAPIEEEVQPQEQDIQEATEAESDSTPDLQAQEEQIEVQRQELEQEREQRILNNEDVADIEQSLAELDAQQADIIEQRLGQEEQAGQQPTPPPQDFDDAPSNDEGDTIFYRGTPDYGNRSDNDGVQYFTDNRNYASFYQTGKEKAENIFLEELENFETNYESPTGKRYVSPKEPSVYDQEEVEFYNEFHGREDAYESLPEVSSPQELRELKQSLIEKGDPDHLAIPEEVSEQEAAEFNERHRESNQAYLEEKEAERKKLEDRADNFLNPSRIEGKSIDLGIGFAEDSEQDIFNKLNDLGIADEFKGGNFLDNYHDDLKAHAEENGITHYTGIKGGVAGSLNESPNEVIVIDEDAVTPANREQPQEVNEENPLVTSDEKYEAWFDPEEGSILTRSRNTGKIVDNRSKNREDVLLEFVRQGSPGTRTTEQAIQEVYEEDPQAAEEMAGRAFNGGAINPEFALKESQDPVELTEAIEERNRQRESEYESVLHTTLVEDFWKGGSEATRLTVGTGKQFGDFDSYGQNIKAQFRNENKRRLGPANQAGTLRHADEMAEIMSDRLGRDVSPSEVVESFVGYHNSLTGRGDRNFDDQIADELSRKFYEVTGQKYTPELANKVLEARRVQQSEEAGVDPEEALSDLENYIDENGNINYTDLANSDGAAAAFLSNQQGITQEDINYVNEQIQQSEQWRQQRPEEEAQEGASVPETEQDAQAAQAPQGAEQQQSEGGSWFNPTQQQYQQAKQRLDELASNQQGQLNTGIDPSQISPEVFKDYLTVGAYKFHTGARRFSDFSKRMIEDIGSQVRPHLKRLYNELRKSGQFSPDNFTDPNEVDRFYEEEIATSQPDQQTQQQNNDQGNGTPPYTTPAEATQDFFADGFSDIDDSVTDAIRVNIQDRFIDLKRYQQKAEDENGPLADIMNAYQEEELFTGQAEYNIEAFKEQFEDPVLEKIDEMGWDIEQAEEYLMARHAPERNRQIAKINPEMPDGGSGMTTQEAVDILEEVHGSDKSQQALELGQLWDDMTKFQRDLLVDSGLATRETMQAWENAYEHYISLKGNEEGQSRPQSGKGFDLLGSFKRATGRTTRAEGAVPNTLSQIRADIVRAQKAEVGKALLRFINEHPNPDLWTVDEIDYQPTINSSTGLVEHRPDPRYKLADNVLNVKVDGRNHHITFHSERGKRLAKSLKNLGPENSGAVVRGVHAVTRYLALLNTGLNPEFIISNFQRDLQTAAINLSSTDADGLRSQIIKDVMKARKGMSQYLSGDTDSEWSRHADNFVKNGGKTGWVDAYKDVDSMQKDLDRRLKSLSRRKGDPRELGKKIFDYIQKQNDAVENAIRLSAFVHSRQHGLTDKQAASLAKNLTVNFNRRGQWGPTLNAWYMFFGASVQGSIRIFQAVKSPKARKIVGGLFAGTIAQDMINRMIGGEDEEDEVPYYDKIPQWVKERNIIIMLPGTDGEYLTIPSPYGYNVINVAGMEVGRAISSQTVGNPVSYSPGESAANIVSAFLDSFNPVGGGGSLLQTFAPTILDPFVQTGQNIDWTGQPIKPPSNPFDMSPIPESQQFYNSAPEWAKAASKEVNSITGGSEARPGMVDVSPEYLEHWFRFLTGGAGNFVDESFDTAVKSIQGKQIEPYRVPFAGKLYGQVSDYNNYHTYNEYLKEIEYAKADLDDARRKRDRDRIKEIKSSEEVWLKHVDMAEDVRSEIQSMRNTRKEIEASDMSFEEKKERKDELNERISTLQKRLIKSVNDALKGSD